MRRRKLTPKKKMEESLTYISQYRCTLVGIQALYNQCKSKLKKGHHDAFEKTPFRHLFKALHDNEFQLEMNKEEMFDKLILCYDRKTKKFKFGSGFYKPTRLDVKLIFGIEDGTKDVGKMATRGKGESELEARHFPNVNKLSAKRVKDKIKELVANEDQESIDDVVKLLCVILLRSVFFANTGTSIPKGFLYYVDDFDRLESYDWSQHVLDELMTGLHDDWSNPKQVNGCILLLPYWFCEHCAVEPVKNGTEKEPTKKGVQEISAKGIPRITKWKLTKLEKLVEKCVLYKGKWLNNNELMPTNAEEYLITSLNRKRKAKKTLIEQDVELEQSPSNDDTLVDSMKRKPKRLKLVKKKKEDSLGDSVERPGVESGCRSEGNQEIENYEDSSERMSNAEAESAYDDLMMRGFDTFEKPMSENVEELRDSSKGKSIAEARKVQDRSMDERRKKKELGKTINVLGKRKGRLTKNIKAKKGLKKDDKTKKLEEEISRLKGIVDSLKWEQVNLIGKQETMAAEHFEMEMALDEVVDKKSKLLYELENEKLARKELLNELTLAKLKIEQLEDKLKENESRIT